MTKTTTQKKPTNKTANSTQTTPQQSTQNFCDETCAKNMRNCCSHAKQSSPDIVYSLGVIGALVYYISTATSFWMGAFGIVKAFVWPAIVVYLLLTNVGALP
jgi:hypothetical protein